MDNADGRMIEKAIEQYNNALVINYNVFVYDQILSSIYNNVMDIGVWCSLQLQVEKRYDGN